MPPVMGSFDSQQEACKQSGGYLAAVLTKEDGDALKSISKLGKKAPIL